ncbi:MAG TPA: hypothetical protein VL974_13265 [Magnetospirillum sp.]|jgi:hypothetical protein|nr:hypothetical protein [Magnetospirillum sp.]
MAKRHDVVFGEGMPIKACCVSASENRLDLGKPVKRQGAALAFGPLARNPRPR